PTTYIYTLSLHDALPIYLRRAHPHERSLQPRVRHLDPARVLRVDPAGDRGGGRCRRLRPPGGPHARDPAAVAARAGDRGDLRLRSEEHTSELQSPYDLVC